VTPARFRPSYRMTQRFPMEWDRADSQSARRRQTVKVPDGRSHKPSEWLPRESDQRQMCQGSVQCCRLTLSEILHHKQVARAKLHGRIQKRPPIRRQGDPVSEPSFDSGDLLCFRAREQIPPQFEPPGHVI